MLIYGRILLKMPLSFILELSENFTTCKERESVAIFRDGDTDPRCSDDLCMDPDVPVQAIRDFKK